MRRSSFVLLVACVLAVGAPGRALSDGPYQGPFQWTTPAYNWAGLYAGLHLGGTWGSTTAYDNVGYNQLGDYWSSAPSGFIGGLQLGYNWLAGSVLYGVEADLGDLGLGGGAATNYIPFSFDTSTRTDADFYLTLRGRLGVVGDQWLLYATGGYFGADTRVSIVDACSSPPCGPLVLTASNESFRSGWTLGGGIEAALSNSWTGKIEYLYYDIGSRTVTGFAGGTAYTWTLETDGQLVRAGLNYSFGKW